MAYCNHSKKVLKSQGFPVFSPLCMHCTIRHIHHDEFNTRLTGGRSVVIWWRK